MLKSATQKFSDNAYTLKFLSILIVFTGHFIGVDKWNIVFSDKSWVIVTYALIFFSFTSGYFTSLRYGVVFDIKSFWKNKLYRIGIEYTFLNIFLVCLFLIQGKQNIFSFSSLISWLGLTGFYNWFNIPGQSPFGAGLWFLTLLLLFYITYPLIAYFCRISAVGRIFVVMFTLMMLYFDATINVHHMLWITAIGFVLGVFFNSQNIFLPFKMCLVIIILELFFLSVANYFHFNIRTSYIILATSIPIICVFFLFRIPEVFRNIIRPVSGTVLGVYILHNYTFIFFTNIFIYDYILSLLYTIFIAYVINFFANKTIYKIQS